MNLHDGACTPGLSVQVIAYRSTPETYITLDSSQHKCRVYSVTACCYHDKTIESCIVHWLSCCCCLSCSSSSSLGLSSAYGHESRCGVGSWFTKNAWTVCAKSGWRCLGPLVRTAIAVTFKWTVIGDYMLVLMILLGQLFFTLPTQASRYQTMRAASHRRRFCKVHWPAVVVVRSPADAPCAAAIVDERIVVARSLVCPVPNKRSTCVRSSLIFNQAPIKAIAAAACQMEDPSFAIEQLS